jgi:hypothetical protein
VLVVDVVEPPIVVLVVLDEPEVVLVVPPIVVVVGDVLVVVVGGKVVVVAVQLSASQQLATPETMHALADTEPRQRAAVFLMAHRETPCAVVRRQTTAPGRPHVDLFAHFTTELRQLGVSSPRWTAVVATARTQRT